MNLFRYIADILYDIIYFMRANKHLSNGARFVTLLYSIEGAIELYCFECVPLTTRHPGCGMWTTLEEACQLHGLG